MTAVAYLRPDNTENNCTVSGDPEGKVGRAHAWMWESAESNYRICTTCGRREFNSRSKQEPQDDPRPD
jgi:hypothetical protein